jgi:hypothetical protein
MSSHPQGRIDDQRIGRPATSSVPSLSSVSSGELQRSAALWINTLGKTLKNWRLYKGQGSIADRFCGELTDALRLLLDTHGPLALQFTTQDILLEQQPLIAEQEVKETLSLVFHRDGVRAVCFSPGIERRELVGLLDAIVLSGTHGNDENDLVTMLWDADLPHIDIDVIPLEGELLEESEAPPIEPGSFLPWPARDASMDGAAIGPDAERSKGDEEPGGRLGRSDDWVTPDSNSATPGAPVIVDTQWPAEARRFREEREKEQGASLLGSAIAITESCFAGCRTTSEAGVFEQFLTRLLREAVVMGSWTEALACMRMHHRLRGLQSSSESVSRHLQGSISMQDLVKRLDGQSAAEVNEFVRFAGSLGRETLSWLMVAMAESQERRNRRVFAQAVADHCREDPLRLEPWISDPRWYVVRNVIYVLGMIGGDRPVELLRTAIHHRDYRVKRQLVIALKGVTPRAARPLLLQMLTDDCAGIFPMVLEALSLDRDPEVSRGLIGYLTAPEFSRRPPDEKSAILAAISATANEETLPVLETQLLKAKLFARSQTTDSDLLAICLAQIGTPQARAILERGTHAWQGGVKKACVDALARLSKNA